jgi:dihydroflavonol-4-reductase
MATLVTGATGLIGSHVTRLLVERGDEVRALVRERSPLEALDGLDVELVRGDALERAAVRRAMRGVDRLFHVAGITSLRAGAETHFAVNVTATQIVLEEALRAGVAGVVYTSSVAAIGPAPRGSTADERQVFRAGRLGLPYVDAKHEAEGVAVRLAARGLPVVVVNPAHTFGTGDRHRSSTELVRRFLRGQIPAYVDGALNIVDAEDVARGHLLADERGVVGERYILGNRNFTLDRLFADLGRLSGVEPRRSSCRSRPPWRWPGPPSWRRACRRSPPSRCGPPRSGGPTARPRPGASSAGALPTTRTRCRRRSTGTAPASRSACARPARASRWASAWPASGCARRAG